MTKVLLIGGPVDGKRVEIDDARDVFEVNIIAPASVIPADGEAPRDDVLQRVIYQRKTMVSRDRMFTVFTYGEMRSFEVIEKLMEGYKGA